MNIVDSIHRSVNSPAFKFILVIVLILALTIPLLFVALLVGERESFARQARSEVGRMWGSAQTVRGPYLIVPTSRVREVRTKAGVEQQTIREFAAFLPEELKVSSQVATENRKRGIFNVPVYRSTIRFEGRFIEPLIRGFEQTETKLHWPEAVLVMTLDDVRGIKQTAELMFPGGAAGARFRAGVGVDENSRIQGIHVPISSEAAQSGFKFTFDLALNGSSQIQFIPAGGETEVSIRSDWPHPSFTGAFLPDAREISDAGFSATWKVPRLARGIGQTIRFYSLAERALKYALGFIGIIFLAVFVMEMKSRKRVHWIQYLFVGLALVIFYLVLIGTAEHIGFDLGYLAAAIATSVLVGSYFGTVVGKVSSGASLAAILGVIYALLFLLLRVEDYAMLIGSLAAFALLALVMFATRNVNWSKGSLAGEEADA
jgi:inner membrane protein